MIRRVSCTLVLFTLSLATACSSSSMGTSCDSAVMLTQCESATATRSCNTDAETGHHVWIVAPCPSGTPYCVTAAHAVLCVASPDPSAECAMHGANASYCVNATDYHDCVDGYLVTGSCKSAFSTDVCVDSRSPTGPQSVCAISSMPDPRCVTIGAGSVCDGKTLLRCSGGYATSSVDCPETCDPTLYVGGPGCR